MQIKIEIDVQPEELRRFLGLPDIAGLQEDLLDFLRDKVSEANAKIQPKAFVKTNLDTIRKSKTVRRIWEGKDKDSAAGSETSAAKAKPTTRRKTTRTPKKK